MVVHACDPSVEDKETGGYLGLPGQPASLLGEFQVNEDAIPKNKVDGAPKE